MWKTPSLPTNFCGGKSRTSKSHCNSSRPNRNHIACCSFSLWHSFKHYPLSILFFQNFLSWSVSLKRDSRLAHDYGKMTFIFQNSFDACSLPGKIRKKMQNDRNSLQDSKSFEFSRHPPTGNVPPELKLLDFPAFFNPRLRKNWTVKFKIIFFFCCEIFFAVDRFFFEIFRTVKF